MFYRYDKEIIESFALGCFQWGCMKIEISIFRKS